MVTRWDERFLASTRGRVVSLLRRGRRTVDELAGSLELTDNAVRSHLAALERDGLVRQTGTRRGLGKPAYAYDLTPDAERLFPKAYGPVLRQVLDVLVERLPPAELDAALREAGRRLGAAQPVPTDRRARLELALTVLGELGGLADLEENGDDLLIRGYDCPLAMAAPGHPEVCALAEALLTEIVGAPVVERCERDTTPRCRFLIPAGAGGTADDRAIGARSRAGR